MSATSSSSPDRWRDIPHPSVKDHATEGPVDDADEEPGAGERVSPPHPAAHEQPAEGDVERAEE